jgi:hypothetical protein
MDLHAWITQQVDRTEAAALAELGGRCVIVQTHDGSNDIVGVVTGATSAAGEVQLCVAQLGVQPRDETPVPVQMATDALRRCEADRRILARHRPDSATVAFPGACEGCGLDDWGLPNTETVNDCPELLDLAHAHGITPEILASLDRPQPPEPEPRTGSGRLGLADILAPRTHTRDVPAALRGPHWKP